MKIKKIGIDIDDVVIDFVGNIVKEVNLQKGSNYTIDDVITWDIAKHLNINLEEFLNIIAKSNIYENHEIVNSSFLEVYKELKNHGHEIIFISSRLDLSSFGKDTVNMTEKFFKKIGIEDKFIITHDKNKYIIEEEINVFIDDSIKNLHKIEKEDIELFLINRPWNGEHEFKRLEKEEGINVNKNRFKRIKKINHIKNHLLPNKMFKNI